MYCGSLFESLMYDALLKYFETITEQRFLQMLKHCQQRLAQFSFAKSTMFICIFIQVLDIVIHFTFISDVLW